MLRRSCRNAVIWGGVVLATLGTSHAEVTARTEDVTFQNGDVTLAGRLYLPVDERRFPAVVFTHGSGDSGRDNPRYQLEAEYLAGFGIASLLYDKRGVGASSGDWRRATFEDLADDALAALRYLQTRSEVDPRAIGMRGSSQSGWILPIAASRSPDVAYLILLSPPGVTPYEQILFDVRTDLEDSGFHGAQIDEALALTHSGLDYARGKRTWQTHSQALAGARSKKWFDIAAGPPVPDHWMWSWIRPMMDFDAVPLLTRIETPVLVVVGDRDRECPAHIAGPRHLEALRARGSGRYSVKIFEGADHGLRVSTKRVGTAEPPLAEGYLETLRDWIQARVRRP